jgi:hypothetical protein
MTQPAHPLASLPAEAAQITSGCKLFGNGDNVEIWRWKFGSWKNRKTAAMTIAAMGSL